MDNDGHFTQLSGEECRRLVRSRVIGRVAWSTSAGCVEVLPVTYTLGGERIAFATSPGSVMGDFLVPREVAFEVDDVEEDTATGWSVVVRGRATGYLDQLPEGIGRPRPWAPGEHRLVVVIEPSGYTGRAVSADTAGG